MRFPHVQSLLSQQGRQHLQPHGRACRHIMTNSPDCDILTICKRTRRSHIQKIWTTYPRACEISCRGLLKGLIEIRIPSPKRVVAKHCTSEPSRPRSEPTACGQIILLQFLALAGCVAGSLEQRCSTRPLVHCGRAALRDASSQTPESFQTAPCCTRGRQARRSLYPM